MSSASQEMSGLSRDPFDFLDAPPRDWLPALDSDQSYNEDDFEVSDPLMDAELSDEAPEVLCALKATSVAEVVPAEIATDAESNQGMSKDVLNVERKDNLGLILVAKSCMK